MTDDAKSVPDFEVATSEGMQHTLRGRVAFVKYASPSFSVGELEVMGQRGRTPFAGKLMVRLNDAVVLTGKWIDHPKWGRQFEVASFQVDTKVVGEGLARYLAFSPDIEGVGIVRARALAERFGEDFDLVATEHAERLCEVPGISEEIAKNIAKVWRQNRATNRARLWLAEHGLTHGQIVKLVDHYGESVQAVLESDPYLLAGEVEGFGFLRADEIAQKIGVPADHPNRVKSAIRHCLYEALNDGSTWVPFLDLASKTQSLLHLASPQVVQEAIDAQVLAGRLVGRHVMGTFVIGLPHAYRAEIEVAETLSKIAVSQYFPDPEEARALVAADGQLNGSQRNACMAALCRNMAVVTGGAGTGKTFTMGAIAGFYEKRNHKVLLVAPTGKAAKRMEEISGREAMTIHRLLGYTPAGEYRVDWIKKAWEVENPALEFPWYVDETTGAIENVAAILVDESSMIDVFLARELFRAVDVTRIAVIFFGDHHQLPPVGPGNFLRDICARQPIPVVFLDQVVRQAGVLKENATAILRGEVRPSVPAEPVPEPVAEPEPAIQVEPVASELHLQPDPQSRFQPESETRASRDIDPDAAPAAAPIALQQTPWVVVDSFKDETKCREYLVRLVTEGLSRNLGFAQGEIQLIVPTHKGPIGVEALNRAIQATVQEKRFGVRVSTSPDSRARPLVGDRVIQTRNNYQLGVMNGTIGEVMEDGIDAQLKTPFWKIEYESGVVTYHDDEFKELHLAYALTVHKAQGSEWPCVVFVAHSSQRWMHSRNLFYTAVTRASKTMVIVGDRKGIDHCAARETVNSRRTWLQIASEIEGKS